MRFDCVVCSHELNVEICQLMRAQTGDTLAMGTKTINALEIRDYPGSVVQQVFCPNCLLIYKYEAE